MTRSDQLNSGPESRHVGVSLLRRLAGHVSHSRKILRATDAAILLSVAPIGLVLRLLNTDPLVFQPPAVTAYMVASGLIGVILWIGAGLHRASWIHASWRELGLIVGISGVTVILASLCGFLADRLVGIPRSLPLFHGVGLVGGLCAVRMLARQLQVFSTPRQQISGFSRTDVLLIGGVDLAIVYLEASRGLGGQLSSIAGLLTDDSVASETLIASIPVLGPVDKLAQVLTQLKFHGVFVRQAVLLQHRDKLPEAIWPLLDAEGIEVSDFQFAVAGASG
jgi:hypothetical protein